MNTRLLAIILIIHFIGAAITIFIHCKDGTMEYAAEHGDGFRLAKPADVITQDLIDWEIQLIINTLFLIEAAINHAFEKKFLEKEKDL